MPAAADSSTNTCGFSSLLTSGRKLAGRKNGLSVLCMLRAALLAFPFKAFVTTETTLHDVFCQATTRPVLAARCSLGLVQRCMANSCCNLFTPDMGFTTLAG
jgi:hypothetical protein